MTRVSGRASATGVLALAAGLALGGCGGDAGPGADPDVPASAAPAPGPSLASAVRSGAIEVTSVAIPEPVAGGRTALYLVAHNGGDRADALLGLASPAAERAGLHRTVARDGVSTMGAVDSVPVPPGGRARLAPGGWHGMLEGLTGPLAAGDTVPVTLRFRGAGAVEVQAVVVGYGDLDALFPPEEEGGARNGGTGGTR